MTLALEGRALSVALGSTQALAEVSLRLTTGWTAIVGPNGAGKSTLLRVLAGLQAADAGEVRLGDRLLADLSPRERGRQIAWLAQQGETSGELTVRETVTLGRLPHRGLFAAMSAADDARVQQALANTEATRWQDRRLADLSGGERQRVLLARALATDAPWLLLDEPTTHLDPPHQVALVRLLQRQVRTGAAVVSVLHDLTLALLADHLVVMQAGRICAAGTRDDPAVHAALIDVFAGAIRIVRLDAHWVTLPNLES